MKLILEDFPTPCQKHDARQLDATVTSGGKMSFTLRCTVCELAVVIPTTAFTIVFRKTEPA